MAMYRSIISSLLKVQESCPDRFDGTACLSYDIKLLPYGVIKKVNSGKVCGFVVHVGPH